MTIQEVITASESKFVEVDRVTWLMFLGNITLTEGHPLAVTHQELTAGSMAATADNVIVYRYQAKELLDLTNVKLERSP